MARQINTMGKSWFSQVDGDTYLMRCPANGEYLEVTVKETEEASHRDESGYTVVLHCVTAEFPERTCIPMNLSDTYEGCHQFAASWLRQADAALTRRLSA